MLPIQNLDAVSAETMAMMEAMSIDVLFATDLCNEAWTTECISWSFYLHPGIILDHHKNERIYLEDRRGYPTSRSYPPDWGERIA